ncbi:MAG TPA: hypothetical protein VFF78_04365, partial [Anaerolineaceae bacterium]|nr:hypothetical protein [Anaerolineaceae bacterium]
TYEAGNFGLGFVEHGKTVHAMQPVVDPQVIFGQNTAFSAPDNFLNQSLEQITAARQITCGKTPCGFFAARLRLEPGQSATLHSLWGYALSLEGLQAAAERLRRPAFLAQKRTEARQLAEELSAPIATHSAEPLFDAYSRQSMLDNLLRGGWPLAFGPSGERRVYHIYSRKHGDLERDYNAFALAAEYYSQGNGNYRDVNQNRRCDVFFNPQVEDFNLRAFTSLIQTDGYNPLVVQGSRFRLSAEQQAAILARLPNGAAPALAQGMAEPFTPGKLLKAAAQDGLPPEATLAEVLGQAEQQLQAAFGEGFWVDHWTYNLDLLDTFQAIYPDRMEESLFARADLPFYDSPAVVQPRARKYVLSHQQARQFGSLHEDEQKAALIAARGEQPTWARTAYGTGEIYRTTLFAKLLSLALNKFSLLDPWGMGIEMEAGKPGWYDALNGLPGLFASSMPETFELLRLVRFLRAALIPRRAENLRLAEEIYALLNDVYSLLQAHPGRTPAEAHFRWDAIASRREAYREQTRLGLSGQERELRLGDLEGILASFEGHLRAGIEQAQTLNHGLPPTYFIFQVEEYALTGEEDAQGRPFLRALRFQPRPLPLFLEGVMRAFKALPDLKTARKFYEDVRCSPLFDDKLKMYKVNASLSAEPAEIGRARAFTPGWLENESIWLHMEYKYLLEVLRAGLYAEFFRDLKTCLVPFLPVETYGRSPLENSSFLVSSVHPDETLHGGGFVARLSGATAEFLSIWSLMMAGRQPFFLHKGKLALRLRPILPGWLFTDEGKLSFTFLGNCQVTYHNPARRDIFEPKAAIVHLRLADGQQIEFPGDIIPQPYAEMVRSGGVASIDIYFPEKAINR